jgi:hypothetical protein
MKAKNESRKVKKHQYRNLFFSFFAIFKQAVLSCFFASGFELVAGLG